jgi:hypothetical protein
MVTVAVTQRAQFGVDRVGELHGEVAAAVLAVVVYGGNDDICCVSVPGSGR